MNGKFLAYLLPKVIRHVTNQCILRKVGNLKCRYQRVQLRTDKCGSALPVDGDGLSLLEYLAETFRKIFDDFADHLAAKDVSYAIFGCMTSMFVLL